MTLHTTYNMIALEFSWSETLGLFDRRIYSHEGPLLSQQEGFPKHMKDSHVRMATIVAPWDRLLTMSFISHWP